jgi:hypothetical protein
LIKTAFDRAGIEMPEPLYRVHMVDAGTVRDRGTPSSRGLQAGDTSKDHHLDAQVQRERAADPDLLEHDAPQE